MEKYITGLSEQADIQIKSSDHGQTDIETVSQQHISVSFKDESQQQLIVEDLQSTNGTFVNGQRIKTRSILPSDQIKLGHKSIDTNWLFGQVKQKAKKHQIHFEEEFEAMKPDFDAFLKAREKVKSKSKRKTLYIRLGISFIPLLGLLYLFATGQTSSGLMYVFIVLSSVLTILTLMFQGGGTEQAEALDKLQAAYERKLACPKCGRSLATKSYAYWKERGTCTGSRCDAKFT